MGRPLSRDLAAVLDRELAAAQRAEACEEHDEALLAVVQLTDTLAIRTAERDALAARIKEHDRLHSSDTDLLREALRRERSEHAARERVHQALRDEARELRQQRDTLAADAIRLAVLSERATDLLARQVRELATERAECRRLRAALAAREELARGPVALGPGIAVGAGRSAA